MLLQTSEVPHVIIMMNLAHRDNKYYRTHANTLAQDGKGHTHIINVEVQEGRRNRHMQDGEVRTSSFREHTHT